MTLIKNIFGRIWAFWGLITFAGTFLLIFIPSLATNFMKESMSQIYFLKISRLWMKTWLFLVGCRVTVFGRENFIQGKTYVVVFNHNAFLDVPLSSPFVAGPNRTIAKASFAKIPLFGSYYSKGSVLVDRKDERSRYKSFEAMKKVLTTGMHMCIYPEGSRNRTDQPLKAFYDGAFKLAIEARKDIIPCVIIGTKKAMPINKPFYLLPASLQMYFLPAVSSENIPVQELKKKVFEMMKECYVSKYQS
ncbi:MAG: lysophospholipid acyltransferase family protein [Ferruginibacter sp.]